MMNSLSLWERAGEKVQSLGEKRREENRLRARYTLTLTLSQRERGKRAPKQKQYGWQDY
jgi:hypothetical protein